MNRSDVLELDRFKRDHAAELDVIRVMIDQKRKKYNRFTTNMVKSYVRTKAKEISLKGPVEAEKTIEKLVIGPSGEVENPILLEIIKNKGAWGEFLGNLAKKYDIERLANFFTELIYGIMISKRNERGEIAARVNINGKQGERGFIRAVKAIKEAKMRGIGVFFLEGSTEDIFSAELYGLYNEMSDCIFFLLERSESDNDLKLYNDRTLNAIGGLNNIFVILELERGSAVNESGAKGMENIISDSQKTNILRKSRALEQKKILFGAVVRENGANLRRDPEKYMLEKTINGAESEKAENVKRDNICDAEYKDLLLNSSAIAVFEKERSFGNEVAVLLRNALSGIGYSLGDALREINSSSKKRTGKGKNSRIFDIGFDFLPECMKKFIKEPDFPLILPEMCDILNVIQFVISGGKIDHISEI